MVAFADLPRVHPDGRQFPTALWFSLGFRWRSESGCRGCTLEIFSKAFQAFVHIGNGDWDH